MSEGMRRNWVYLFVFLFIFVVLLGVVVLEDDLLKPEPDGKSKMDTDRIRIVMLGNSLTFRVDWKKLLNRQDVANRGINGNTLRDMLGRLERIIALKPDICLIMGGINDISRGRPVYEIFDDYTTVVETLSEQDIHPVIQSTLYITGSLVESVDINRQVRRLNQKLKEYAEKNAIPFVNLNQTMSNSRGLKAEHTVDGVHLSQKGYQAWSRVLIPLLTKLDGME